LDERAHPPGEHDEAERKLANVLDEAERKVAQFYQAQGYSDALRELLKLRGPIDQFFLDVLVMAEDAAARDRRLKLLRRVQRLFLGGWDFSQVSCLPLFPDSNPSLKESTTTVGKALGPSLRASA